MTSAKAAMAVVTFNEELKHARELIDEGHRLLHVANRDLKAGTILVRRTQELLTNSESVFRAKRRLQAGAGIGSIGLGGVPPASMASPADRQRSSR
ncbi:indole-3-glycerol phosphate synthase [Nitrobacteraceae bacterium AZCC 1564]